MAEEEKDTNAKPKQFRKRSPEYPGVDIETALERAGKLYEMEGCRTVARQVMFQYWKSSPISGFAGKLISSLLKFDFIQKIPGSTQEYRVTSFAEKIILDKRPGSTDRENFIRKSFIGVPIYREIFDKYQGTIPPNVSFEHYLRVDRGFNENSIEPFIELYKLNFEFAKMDQYKPSEIAPDPLPEPEEKHSIEKKEIRTPPDSQDKGEKMKNTIAGTLLISESIPGICEIKINIIPGIEEDLIDRFLERTKEKLLLMNEIMRIKDKKNSPE